MAKTKTDVRPDWLTVTGQYQDQTATHPIEEPTESAQAWVMFRRLCGAFEPSVFRNERGWKEVKSPPYYRYALMNSERGMLVAFGGAKQGYMIQFHGTFWANEKLRWHWFKENVYTQGLRPTRFDWSATVSRDDGFEWMNAEYLFDYARLTRDAMGRKTPRLGMPVPVNDEQTMQGGSRRSAKHIRFYDKPYWSEDYLPAVRFEIEYKKDAAPTAFRMWLYDPDGLTADMLNYAFQDPAHWPSGLPDLFEAREGNIRSTLPKEPTNREKWFNGVVRKSFEYWAQEEPEKADMWLNSARDVWNDLKPMSPSAWDYIDDQD